MAKGTFAPLLINLCVPSATFSDALFISTMDFLTSLMGGIVIFSILGNMSHELGIPISDVASQGQGLAFVAYPEALSRLVWPQLWSFLFFFMLFLLGLDSEVSSTSLIPCFFFSIRDHPAFC